MISETICLASAIKSDVCFVQVTANLKSSYFSSNEHGKVFAYLKRHGSCPDLRVMAEDLGLGGQITAELDGTPCYKDGGLDHHIEILREAYKKRQFYNLARFIDAHHKTKSSGEMINSILDVVNESSSMDTKPSIAFRDVWKNFHNGKDYLTYLEELVASDDKKLDGVLSGFSQLDDIIGCFFNNSLTIIGAGTHVGKTSFALSIAMNICRDNPDACVHFISLEMPAKRLLERFVAQKCCINVKDLTRGKVNPEEMDRINETSEEIQSYNIIFEDSFSMTISALRAKIKQVHQKHKSSIIFIDYLTKILPDRDFSSKHLGIDSVTKGLQSLCSDISVPIVCLSQLNRNSQHEGKKPCLHHLRESGSIEEDADTVILLHRPDKFDPDIRPGLIEANVAKNRIMLETGIVNFSFDRGRLVEEPSMKQMHQELANERFKDFSN